MDFTNLLGKVKGLEAFNGKDEVSNIVDENSDALVKSMQEQLIEGKDISGFPRSDSYRPFTKAYKRMFGIGPGAIIDHVTFYMTGTLSESLYYSRSGDVFTIQSQLDTYGKMIDRIGFDEYGIDPQRRLFFANTITLPNFKKVFTEKTTFIIE